MTHALAEGGRSARRGLTAPTGPLPGQERPLRILIATDAWTPQVNGVVRTLETLRSELLRMGHDVRMITPEQFRTVPMPTYPEIKLAIFPGSKVRRLMNEYGADTVHIATEGPIGLAVRRYCRLRGIRFTTSFHTRFPEYVHARFGMPTSWSYAALRWFHNPSSAVMVATQSLLDELQTRGFFNLRIWSRGVDVELFKPRPKDWLNLPRPIWLYVGRIAVEKNVESFLSLDLPGTKLIIGDGPMLTELKMKFPAAQFTGPKFGEELAQHYSASDVFVFPSKTDTFGLVILEALASGLPVAAYPVQGPLDVIGAAPVGALDEDLARACARAQTISGLEARKFAMNFSWESCTRQFLSNLSSHRTESATPP